MAGRETGERDGGIAGAAFGAEMGGGDGGLTGNGALVGDIGRGGGGAETGRTGGVTMAGAGLLSLASSSFSRTTS